MTVRPVTTGSPLVLALRDPRATATALTGGKASRLAELASAGFPVPDGFVVTTKALDLAVAALGSSPTEASILCSPLPPAVVEALAEGLATLEGPYAVRSSGVAEDLAGASFAGQYETVLDVNGLGDVAAAVSRCLASAYSDRVRSYREGRGIDSAPIAVLVQRYIPARAAGVAFTANPVTGERDVVVLSAIPGVGEALVSGQANAEEWEVRGSSAVRRRSPHAVLTEGEALAVAELARRVGNTDPTDIEWALLDGQLHLLQARPMTALPEPVSWESPLPGGWIRNFRAGEWLGAPVSTLFEGWLLTDVERGTHDHIDQLFGARSPGPLHVVVNGWYFYGLRFELTAGQFLAAVPTLVRHLITRWTEIAAMVPPLARFGFDPELKRWRESLLPAWRTVVARAETQVDSVAITELPALIQGLIEAMVQQQVSILGVAGYAAKAEGAVMEFVKKHLAGYDGSVNEWIVGADVAPAAHDVEGLDWVFPTLGEVGPVPPALDAQARGVVLARRDAAEARATAALPMKVRAKFTALVGEARRAHAVRLEQTGVFTLGHPVMRRALLRIGEQLVAQGILTSRDEVFFLTRAEVQGALAGPIPRPPVAERRATWERQRRLTPPLQVGELTGFFKAVFAEMDTILHHEEHDAPDALRGMPGSPGRVTGTARVILSVDELHRLQPGEILVAPITTPMWTLAFGRALAIVTDTGSVASHASIVAREHGIPAVVGTGSGTARIVDGQRITVDGGRGVVRLGG